MTGHRPFSELTAKLSPESRARVAQKVAGLKDKMALAELRQVHQRSQQDLATALNVNQPAIAKLEKRAHTSVATLRRYIEALGGTLEITARFHNKTIVISPPPPPSTGKSRRARRTAAKVA